MEPLGDVGQVESRFFCLETVLVSVQDRCMVCAKCTIGLQIILDAPNGTPRSRGSCGMSLLSVWRQCWCRCKIGAWFTLDIVDGTTR